MHKFLLLPILLFAVMLHAQPPVKTLPGVLQFDVDAEVTDRRATASGNSIAIRSQFLFALFDAKKGTVTRLDNKMNMISSNHRYTFVNGSYVARSIPWSPSREATEIKSAGINTDTAIRILRIDYHVVDIDDKGQLVATKMWYDSGRYGITGLKGLYKLDRTTGKILQTLRDDTLFVCTRRADWGCWPPTIYVQKNFAVIKTFSDQPNCILPFGETGKIPLPRFHTVLVDSLVVFTINDSTTTLRNVHAVDSRTGALICGKLFDHPKEGSQVFQVYANKLYQLRDDKGMITEETPGKDGFTQTKTWNLNSTMQLPTDQRWTFVVLKGPSFFVVPELFNKAETLGGAANTAWLFDGPSNKAGLQVYPFYINRTSQEIATANATQEANNKYFAKVAAEKDSIAHPERYCNKFWNTDKYWRGMTIFWGGGYYIMSDYDCKADKYILWMPGQSHNSTGIYMEAKAATVPGGQFREGYYSINKHYETCTTCDGDGHYEVTEYTTKTKELPWGYFSGIQTKLITTKTTKTIKTCSQCSGNGVVLKDGYLGKR